MLCGGLDNKQFCNTTSEIAHLYCKLDISINISYPDYTMKKVLNFGCRSNRSAYCHRSKYITSGKILY